MCIRDRFIGVHAIHVYWCRVHAIQSTKWDPCHAVLLTDMKVRWQVDQDENSQHKIQSHIFLTPAELSVTS